MLAARNAGLPTTINTYDYRQNYQEVSVGTGGSNSSEFQIGENSSYSVGALNTGTTDITVTGDDNDVSSVISSDSSACVDGSMTRVSTGAPNLDASFGIDISNTTALGGMTCQ